MRKIDRIMDAFFAAFTPFVLLATLAIGAVGTILLLPVVVAFKIFGVEIDHNGRIKR